jgi:hypothetical protein
MNYEKNIKNKLKQEKVEIKVKVEKTQLNLNLNLNLYFAGLKIRSTTSGFLNIIVASFLISLILYDLRTFS